MKGGGQLKTEDEQEHCLLPFSLEWGMLLLTYLILTTFKNKQLMRTDEKSLKEENERKNQVPEKLSEGISTLSSLSALDK